jgi:hypothetical protein
MAIAKKGLRKINVEGEDFYWRVRKKISHNEAHNNELGIPVQHSSGGQLLLVYLGFCRSYGYGTKSIESVTPSLIKNYILEAIKLGWQFNQNGKPISVRL